MAAACVLLVVVAAQRPPLSPWDYLFRWYVWPGERPTVPAGYTGIWWDWSLAGRLVCESTWAHGRLDGQSKCWDDESKEYLVCVFRNDEPYDGVQLEVRGDWTPGARVTFYEKGRLVAAGDGTCRANRPWDGEFWLCSNVSATSTQVYRSGVLVAVRKNSD
jgi:hypothetical protein